jgi:hypothetical protein
MLSYDFFVYHLSQMWIKDDIFYEWDLFINYVDISFSFPLFFLLNDREIASHFVMGLSRW